MVPAVGAVPVPVRPTVCGLVARVSVTLRAAVAREGKRRRELDGNSAGAIYGDGAATSCGFRRSRLGGAGYAHTVDGEAGISCVGNRDRLGELVVPTFWLEKVRLGG